MAIGQLGSFVGTVSAGEDLLEKLSKGRISKNSTAFTVRKIGIQAAEGVRFLVNGEEVVLTSTGIFELGYDMAEIHSIVFLEEAEINVRFLY